MLVYSVFFLLSIVTVKSTFFSYDGLIPYTKIAYTTSGLPCIGGCSPDTHECIAEWPPTKMSCTIRNQLAPIYFTTQKRGNQKYCISNCGKFNKINDWCFTTMDGKWDYCSSHVRGKAEERHVERGGRLANGLSAYTKKGKLCTSACVQNHGKEQYYWCYYNSIKWDYCAPSALSKIPILTADYNVGPFKSNCDLFSKLLTNERTGRSSYSKARAGFVAEIANALKDVSEWDPDVVQKVYQVRTGVKSHTLVNVTFDNGESAYVPVIVEANVGNNTIYNNKMTARFGFIVENDRGIIFSRKSKEPDYQVPVSENLREMLSNLERTIVKWYSDGRGSVDSVLVIFYPEDNTEVPLALGINISIKNKDGSIYYQCDDSIYFNKM